jgi:hypothetical protein
MTKGRYLELAASAAIGVALAGCSGGGHPTVANASGATLSVSLMDAPVDDVTEVNVSIKAVWLKPADGQAFELPLTSAPFTTNLIGLTDQNAALLVDQAEIPAGTYEWLAMDVNADFDGIFDSFVMTKAGGQVEVRVPSGRVRLVDGFEVTENRAVKLVFDWDMRTGLVAPPGQPGDFLKPAFRVLDVSTYGELHGTVASDVILASGDPNGCLGDDTDPEVGNVIYIYSGADVLPDDIDGMPPDPVATAWVEQNSAGDFVYRTILAPGEYTVAFTCQAANDDPEADESATPKEIQFLPPLDRTIAGADVSADF